MADYIYFVLVSNHKWFACNSYSESIKLAEELIEKGYEYVEVIRGNKVVHLTTNDIKMI